MLVDCSSSMRLVDRHWPPGAVPTKAQQSRWQLAQDALELLVPRVVERDDDGISLYFFATDWEVHRRVTSAAAVRRLFRSRGKPFGGTR